MQLFSPVRRERGDGLGNPVRHSELDRRRFVPLFMEEHGMQAGNRHSTSSAAHDLSRLPWAALICAAVLLSGVALAWAKARDGVPVSGVVAAIGDSSKGTERPTPPTRLREGSDFLDQRGYFKQVRDRLVFFTADGKRQITGLENLALERVQRAVSDVPTQQDWDRLRGGYRVSRFQLPGDSTGNSHAAIPDIRRSMIRGPGHKQCKRFNRWVYAQPSRQSG